MIGARFGRPAGGAGGGEAVAAAVRDPATRPVTTTRSAVTRRRAVEKEGGWSQVVIGMAVNVGSPRRRPDPPAQ
ncbi:hypothetical protein ES5_02514 [Dietzia cinnamea P4]|nr:hypothetical protein ES5_02514 [Dietzia cinnamea P4]